MDELDENLKRIRNAVESKISMERQRLAPKVACAPAARFENGLASGTSAPSTSPVEADSAPDASQQAIYDDNVEAPSPIEAGQEGGSIDYDIADDQSNGKHRSVEQSEGTPDTRDPSKNPTADPPNRTGQQTQSNDAKNPSSDIREPSRDIAVSKRTLWSKFKRFVGLG